MYTQRQINDRYEKAFKDLYKKSSGWYSENLQFIDNKEIL